MKYLLCLFVLVIPGISLAAIDVAQVTEPKPAVAEISDSTAQHHPVIEVKFVLVRAPRDQQALLHGDVDSQRSTIMPFSLSGRHAVPLGGSRYWNPNSYWWGQSGCLNCSR